MIIAGISHLFADRPPAARAGKKQAEIVCEWLNCEDIPCIIINNSHQSKVICSPIGVQLRDAVKRSWEVAAISFKEKRSMDTQIMEEALRKDTSPTELIQMLPKSSLQSFLLTRAGKMRISTDALAELAALNRASLYKILNGTTRQPQRNVLLRLALVLRLSFEETQTLLRYGGRAALSGSRGRDIIISDGIIKQRTIEEVNAHLQSHYFVDLYSKE